VLAALILRGVAFEFRQKAGADTRWVWDAGFAGGSFVAAFLQGAAVGALVRGLPVGADGRFAGSGAFDWVSPFALLCGVGLCLGDALLGATWLVLKSDGPQRDRSYRAIPWLLAGVLVFLAFAFIAALRMDIPVMHRWIERPWLGTDILYPEGISSAIDYEAELAVVIGKEGASGGLDLWRLTRRFIVHVSITGDLCSTKCVTQS
jgi:cytochrome d ubiquinol oxidase subunit II